MSVLTNNRRELFAQLLFQGFTAVDAYEKAGFKRHSGNASILARHPEVEDQAPLPPEPKSPPKASSAGAVENHQYDAANGAIKNKGIPIRRLDRAQRGWFEFDHLTDEELEQQVRERLIALGWMPVPAITNGSILLNGGSHEHQDDD